MTEPAPDLEARMALWERHRDTAVYVAIAAGRYIEAVQAADQAMVDIRWTVLVEVHAEHQAVVAALGLIPPEGAQP
jgi:hypothetical protein